MPRWVSGLCCALGLAALQEAAMAQPVALPEAARAEEEVEAAELAEVESLRTELLQMKVSSAATFNDAEDVSLIQGDAKASVVIDDLADFQTMFVQTDVELAANEA
mmetsp:Transcript_13794/g.25859  ORF Transcript_13794/g.25859 Transcript_13794/m.25859 type:complete len:106 (-) Transcript_13794:108-425(-)